MGHCLSTISRSSEITGQGRTCDISQRQNPHIVSIHILDDDSLLNVFYLYRPFFLGEDETEFDRIQGGRMLWDRRGRWWYQLAHVCQRWRILILGSASNLQLSLVCTNGMPVQNMLAHSPSLPLTVDYYSENGSTAEDEEGILLAFEQRHRIRHLRLLAPARDLQRLVKAIDGEFPILEYLIVHPMVKDDTTLVLPETLQAPHLRHLLLDGFTCPIRPRLHPTSASLVTFCLIVDHQSYFQPNVLLQWISYMPQLECLNIAFTFPVANHDVERQLSDTPITAHITLPNLRLLRFRGVCAYLDAVVRRITTPRLESLLIRFFEQLTLSIPRLPQFMNTTQNLRSDNAVIMFTDESVFVETWFRGTESADTHPIFVAVDCCHFDWQVSSMAQISMAFNQVLSAVEHLTLLHGVHSRSSEEHNDVDRIQWRHLLRQFSNVKTLRFEDGLVGELSRCLRLEGGELPLELLPELQELTYFGSHDTGAFASFIDARQNAGRPVTLVSDAKPTHELAAV